MLLEVVTEKGWSGAKKAQITEHCHVTSEILQLFDGLFAESQKDSEQSTKESRLSWRGLIQKQWRDGGHTTFLM
jgi:hypothetical protein